ncbi:MAG: hypothetical protein CO103_01730 [Chloroflexi bacterium CG_4_9_14_3_um_filter_45_9]|nr:MAG: hypothetical protein CO103_01730 [Chloroflexi bacterium CG_4_9_14_3_um_filter_45_9]
MAQIPNYDRAITDPVKLKDYVLCDTHPIGRFKAALFQQMGYGQENWEQFTEDIRTQHLSLDAKLGEKTKYGQKYIIVGDIKGPNGKVKRLKSIWIILVGEDFPRFITIYPEEEYET